MQGFSLVTGTTKAQSFAMSLNIDSRLNNTAYEALAGRNGAVLVMNYKNGELLCMVSSPSIDPLADNSNPPDGAYINRCLSASFTPGSVFKLITAAAAIENIPDIFSRTYYCEGRYTIAGVEIYCSQERITRRPLSRRSPIPATVPFAQITVSLGQDTMVEYVKKYGFLDAQSLDGISTAAGSYPTEFVGDPELGGRASASPPICLPLFPAALCCRHRKRRHSVEPRLVMSGAEPVKTALMEADTADKLKQMMNYNVVDHYDSDRFPGLNVCAKTGTAELGDGDSHSWFVGFLADEAHPYAFVVLVERGGGGLTNAGAVANNGFLAGSRKYSANPIQIIEFNDIRNST